MGENNKKIGLILLIMLTLVALPFLVFQARQRQETRSKAAGGGAPVSFALVPNTTTVSLDTQFDVKLKLDASNNSISFVNVTLAFDKDVLKFVSFQPTSVLSTELFTTPNNSAGTFSYAAADKTRNLIRGELELGTVRFKAAGLSPSPGTPVTFQAVQVTASDVENALPVSGNVEGSYIVIAQPTPTPTATPTLAPTPTPTPTPAPGSTVIPIQIALQEFVKAPQTREGKAPASSRRVRTDTEVRLVPQMVIHTGTPFNTKITLAWKEERVGANLGFFEGNIVFPPNILPTGTYNILVKEPNHLRKTVATAVAITAAGQNTTVDGRNNPLTAGNVDGDNKIDVADVTMMVRCLAENVRRNLTDCSGREKDADVDGDGTVTIFDYNWIVENSDKEDEP